MAGTYELKGLTWPLEEVTDFATGVMPLDTLFKRESEGSRIDETGLMIFSPNDVGRFTYEPVTHVLRGFLNEPKGTNFVFASEDLSVGYPIWFNQHSSNTDAAGVVAPDGGTNGNQKTEFADLNGHSSYQGPNILYPSTMFSVSAYFQPVERIYACVSMQIDGTHYFAAVFDLPGLAVGETLNGDPADDTLNATTILDAGGGWCQCILSGTFLPGSSGTLMELGPAPLLTGNTFSGGAQIYYLGDGTSRINMWGFQAEIGAPSSYIRNTSTSGPAVRAADVLKLLRAKGTYDMEVTRRDGVQTLTGQVVTDGTLLVPNSLSPLLKVVTTRTA
jgi:hypothetical protein